MTYWQPLFPLLLLLSLVAACRKPRAGTRSRLALWSAAGMFLLSFPPASMLALLPLERPYSHQPPPSDSAAQAMVVLSSAVFPPSPPIPTPIVGDDTAERCIYAAWLYHHGFEMPVLLTGGGMGKAAPYALHMKQLLMQQGVPAERIWIEDSARSTYENAANSAAMLRARNVRRILLVTEAYHMLRAELCFRKQGLEVVPAACGFRAVFDGSTEELTPGWEAISWNEQTLHELIGLAWYKLKGRI